MLQINISGQNSLLDEVIVHLNVLGPSVKDWVPSQVNTTHIVAIEESQICNGNVKILQDSLSGQNLLLNEMIVHINVLGPSVKDWVPSQVNTAHIVAIEES